jgi:uncharacterized protein (TIGR02246 family)
MAGDALSRWMDAYVRAWTSNDPEDIAALFTEDATYRTAPSREPRRGREAIAAGWVEDKDEAGTWRFRWEPAGTTEDGVTYVRGWTDYLTDDVDDYDNLWALRLEADGRVSDFTEWWMVRK